MNYLAHAVFGRETDGLLFGGFLGDFVRGRVRDAEWPPDVGAGIRLHRAIDVETDTHLAFRRCRQLIGPERHRLAGIIVDLCWDHCLILDWEAYCPALDQDAFIDRCYRVVGRFLEVPGMVLPPHFARAARAMREHDWLRRYGTIEGMEETFWRVSRRADYLRPLKESASDLVEYLPEFRAGLKAVFADLDRVTVRRQ